MLYSRPIWPVLLLWLAFMLTTATPASAVVSPHRPAPNQTGPCPPWLRPDGNERLLLRYLEQFDSILARFDCPQPYSVIFHCPQCKEAYMAWLCTSLYKYQWVDSRNEQRSVKPCRSFCHRVEQKCPFFLPLDKGPVHYAGEPTFLCLDPNIEETGEQLEKSSYGPDGCCYDLCASGVCIQGSCREETVDGEGSTRSGRSRGSSKPPSLLFSPLLAPILIFRTRFLRLI